MIVVCGCGERLDIVTHSVLDGKIVVMPCKVCEKTAYDEAHCEGYDEGHDDGYDDGYENGRSDREDV